MALPEKLIQRLSTHAHRHLARLYAPRGRHLCIRKVDGRHQPRAREARGGRQYDGDEVRAADSDDGENKDLGGSEEGELVVAEKGEVAVGAEGGSIPGGRGRGWMRVRAVRMATAMGAS